MVSPDVDRPSTSKHIVILSRDFLKLLGRPGRYLLDYSLRSNGAIGFGRVFSVSFIDTNSRASHDLPVTDAESIDEIHRSAS